MAMELCTATFTNVLFFSPSFSLPSSNSLLLRSNSAPFKFNSLKLSSSFTPHIHLFHHSSFSPFTVSASSSSSSSVAIGTEHDRLPAELKVTETEEPNSRVRLHVEMPPLVCEDCYSRVIAEFMKQAKSFRFGPQISNVHELDVVTGKGDIVTCSAKKNSELFYAVLGGLGQFGVITGARIALGPAPTRAKWLRLLYNDFSAFSRDQEYLISFNERNETHAADGVEGFVLLNQPQMDLSFYPASDKPRITSLVTQHGIIYILELIKYYDNSSKEHADEDVQRLTHGLKFVPTFIFEKDMPYEEYLNRIHAAELLARQQGLWEVPNLWLNLFVPRSRISDFDQGVFKDIILKQNLTAGFLVIHPMNRTKWDDKMSAVIPDEEVFYRVSFLQSTVLDKVEEYEAQNREILKFCANAGIGVKQYLPQLRTQEEWVQHFGPKWKVFEQRKDQFDPNRILSPGQRIFN